MGAEHQPERDRERAEAVSLPPVTPQGSGIDELASLQHPDLGKSEAETSPTPAIEVGWEELMDIARHCPSPHNIQPWRLEPTGGGEANLYVDGSRTFPWTDRTGSFILSSMKMFAVTMGIAAQNRGLKLNTDVQDLEEIDMQAPHSLFARLSLTPVPDLPPHEFSDGDLLKRKTSRKPNLERPIPEGVVEELQQIATRFGQSLVVTGDQAVIDRTLKRDINALFHDLNYREYFSELKPWIRLGAAENSPEGLHFKAMELPRWQLALMKHLPGALKLPIFSSYAAKRYRRDLGHCQEMGFVSGDFWDREQSLKSGEMLINMWLKLSRHDIHIHPFGNLVTNTDARAEVEQDLGLEKLWFVFRMGYTDSPVQSQRLPVDKLMLKPNE